MWSAGDDFDFSANNDKLAGQFAAAKPGAELPAFFQTVSAKYKSLELTTNICRVSCLTHTEPLLQGGGDDSLEGGIGGMTLEPKV